MKEERFLRELKYWLGLKKGILCFADKGKIRKPLNLEDLARIDKWGAMVSEDYLKNPVRV